MLSKSSNYKFWRHEKVNTFSATTDQTLKPNLKKMISKVCIKYCNLYTHSTIVSPMMFKNVCWNTSNYLAQSWMSCSQLYVMKLSIFKILNHIEIYKIVNVIVFCLFKSSITILLSHITISTRTHVVRNSVKTNLRNHLNTLQMASITKTRSIC